MQKEDNREQLNSKLKKIFRFKDFNNDNTVSSDEDKD